MNKWGAFLCLFLALTVGLSGAGAQAACAAKIDFLVAGEARFASGDYASAAAAFACAAKADPLNLEPYQRQIEANLFGGAYAAALQNMTDVAIAVIPENPDAFAQLISSYAAALDAGNPDDLRLLTGYSFVLWHQYETQTAFDVLQHILTLDPDNFFGRAFRGSSYFFLGDAEHGQADFALALEQQPESADLRFIIADAYLYGAGDLENSLAAALEAQQRGLDTPRLNAILGSAYFGLGEQDTALDYFGRHIDRATVETIAGEPLETGSSVSIHILPGQTYTFPVAVEAGQTLTLATTSEQDGVDSIMVLAAADGALVTGNDDSDGFNAGFEWTATEAGTYTLRLSTFEGAGTGEIVLTRS